MRDTLEALARGDISVTEAEAALAGYATTDAGRYDAAREERRGVPEAILADGKTPGEVADLAATALETTGRALVTRADVATVEAVSDLLGDTETAPATVEYDERTDVLIAETDAYEPPSIPGTVAIVTGGTSDAGPAGEAAAVAGAMGASVERVDDVGVASLARTVDALPTIRGADAVVVAAGREGSLPTVVAGLVDAPVIGLPVSTGYGHAGAGEAALDSLLQSCTVLTAVNIDAGYVAGAQAGLIARGASGASSSA
jgi:NCAIR mutase (PurE)-related protein